ncbi:MAG TPA: hypothetical protein DCL49_04475 [Candidatus Omnitrophica bacterium]|nr:hypothetical protein [Candidatus Omnitrophota bacterium]
MRKGIGGFTLIEIVITIAIIAILLSAIGVGSGVMGNAKVNSAAQSVKQLHTAAQSYIAAGNMTFTGISAAGLVTSKFLPDGFSATASNPWGGDYTVAVNASDSSKVDIALTSVPADAGTRLSALFKNSASATTYVGTTWTATF